MKKIVTIILLALLHTAAIHSQSLNSAKDMYKAGEYAQSKDIFYKFLKARPNDASLNQWYGVCLYQTGEVDAAIPYLEKAASREILESYLYLGEIYFKQYNFEQAVKNYQKYCAQLGDADPLLLAQAEYQLGLARRAESMLKRTEKIEIIDSTVVCKLNFLDKYKLSPEAGVVDYLTTIIKPTIESPYQSIYQTERQDKIIYSKLNTDSIHQLYERVKLGSGNWSDAVALIPNPQENNIFPYLLSDGLTLYYASDNLEKGIGGYDIYITRKTLNTGEYLMPENIGMPFNSTANDYMMAIDEYSNIGWFATDRNQPQDSVIIYTFIPQEMRETYRDLTPSEIIPYAQLQQISATQNPNRDYNSLKSKIAELAKPQISDATTHNDICFVVSPTITYKKYSQFKSAKALKYYQQSVAAQNSIDKIKEELENLRYRYSTGTKTPQIEEQILNLESQIERLYPEPKRLNNLSRQAEIEELNNI